jgi:hypothetical protein
VCEAADRAMQVHGGMGYSRHKPFEHIYRHHRRYRITEGSEEIQMRRVPLYEEPKLVVQFDTKGSTEIILTDVVTNYLSGLATPKSRSLAESATACIVGATSLVTNRQGLTQDIVNAFPCILLFNQIVGHGEVPSGQAAGQGVEAGVRRSKLWSELLEFVGKAIVVAHGP